MKQNLHITDICLSGLLVAAATAFTAVPALSAPQAAANTSGVYRMPRKSESLMLRPYSSTTYTGNRTEINTMRGDELHSAGKDTIVSFEVNPAGFNYIVVEHGRKGKSAAALYSTIDNEARGSKFDVKKYGTPSVAVYTPDARSLIVATDRAIYICNGRTLVPEARLANAPFIPDAMSVSPNGFFLAVVKGDRCIVYNLENRTVRKEINAGARITDVAFSPDNSDMALLTDDGVLTIYATRTFDMRKMVDDLGDGVAMAYNLDGKYVGVVKNDGLIQVVNLLNDSDREDFTFDGGAIHDIDFILDSNDYTLMVNTLGNSIEARRLMNLKPYYNRLVNDEVDALMADWLKMMPGETLEEYRARVTDQTRADKRRMFEYEIATKLAGNLLGGAAVSIGSYDRANGVLAVNFDTMPTIFLPVPENEVTAFRSASDIVLDDVLFGINPDDSFEIVYAKVTNRNNGKTYVFDNLARATMNYMNSDDAISIEALQQQQMEELRLQELREKVVQEAKSRNVISDHTNITVDSRIVPEYDADGNKVLNYLVTFTYDVAPGFSAEEDFGPGKYHVEESGAASSMLEIVKKAFEGDLAQYLKAGKKVRVSLTGSADATPIMRGIAYDGSYGNLDNEPVYVDGQLSSISINSSTPIKENSQLAFVRALGVKDFLDKKVNGYAGLNKDYRYEVNVSTDKGSEFRRIKAAFTFVDAF